MESWIFRLYLEYLSHIRLANEALNKKITKQNIIGFSIRSRIKSDFFPNVSVFVYQFCIPQNRQGVPHTHCTLGCIRTFSRHIFRALKSMNAQYCEGRKEQLATRVQFILICVQAKVKRKEILVAESIFCLVKRLAEPELGSNGIFLSSVVYPPQPTCVRLCNISLLRNI